MKATLRAHRGIMPQALGAGHVRVARETAKYRLPNKPGKRMTATPARARASEHRGGHRGQSERVFTVMHPPQDKAFEDARKTWRRLGGQNLLPKLIANWKFKDRIKASSPHARTAA